MLSETPAPQAHKPQSRTSHTTGHPSRTIKFNLSSDNLRPFVHTSRTPSKKPSYRQLCEKRARPASKTEASLQEREELRVGSPDVLREVSNLILKAIETKGIIGCVWDEVEQVRSEYPSEKGEDEAWGQRVWCEPLQDKNKSVASTNDQFSGYYAPNYQQNYVAYDYERRYYDPDFFLIDIRSISRDGRTTLMIKNIPNKYTIQTLAEEIDRQHANCYDFLYFCDKGGNFEETQNNCNVGYGFINFLNTDILNQFYNNFHNQRWRKFKSEKICNLTYARLQGLGSLIEHFQNSKVLNHKDKKYQPIIREFKSIGTLIQSQQALTHQSLGQE